MLYSIATQCGTSVTWNLNQDNFLRKLLILKCLLVADHRITNELLYRLSYTGVVFDTAYDYSPEW